MNHVLGILREYELSFGSPGESLSDLLASVTALCSVADDFLGWSPGPGHSRGGMNICVVLPPVPPVLVLADRFTGGTGGRFEVLREPVKGFRVESVTYPSARFARPPVGVVAASGAELRHRPGFGVPPHRLQRTEITPSPGTITHHGDRISQQGRRP